MEIVATGDFGEALGYWRFWESATGDRGAGESKGPPGDGATCKQKVTGEKVTG